MHGYKSNFNTFDRLYLVLRGIRKTQGNSFKKKKRTPVTPNMLNMIRFNLFNSSIRYEDKLMIWAAMLVAFFGFLRVSEYTSLRVTSCDPSITLMFQDMEVNNNSCRIRIKSSKTDPFREGADIRLASNQSSLCPVEAIKKFIQIHPSQDGPLFMFQDRKNFTRKKVTEMLQIFGPSYDKNISSHSFHIGAATTAASAGYPRWLIQSLGRWTSNCFQEYIQIPDSTINTVSKSLVTLSSSYNIYDPDLITF